MAKLYKVEMYILDVNDDYSSLEDIIVNAENYTDIYFKCFKNQEVNIDWHDDIDINFDDCPEENYKNYFK